jgi:hypothetical protein
MHPHTDCDEAFAIPMSRLLGLRWIWFLINTLTNAGKYQNGPAVAQTANGGQGFDSMGDLLTALLSVRMCFQGGSCDFKPVQAVKAAFKRSGPHEFSATPRL